MVKLPVIPLQHKKWDSSFSDHRLKQLDCKKRKSLVAARRKENGMRWLGKEPYLAAAFSHLDDRN